MRTFFYDYLDVYTGLLLVGSALKARAVNNLISSDATSALLVLHVQWCAIENHQDPIYVVK